MKKRKNQIKLWSSIFAILGLYIQIAILKYSVIDSINHQILIYELHKIAWNDVEYQCIPNGNLAKLIICRSFVMFIHWIIYEEQFFQMMISSALDMGFIGIACFVFYLLVSQKIGAGDMKLFAVLGFYIGKEKMLMISFYGLCYAGMYQVAKLALKKTILKEKLPLAPFVLMGTITVLFFNIKNK